MTLQGGLLFKLDCAAGEVRDVSLTSARPLQLSHILRGKTIVEGLASMGLMYRICSVAQRAAGLAAWRQATGIAVTASVLQAQAVLLKLESLREHLVQVLMIWPQLRGEAPVRDKELSLVARVMAEMEQALFAAGQGMTVDAKVVPEPSQLSRLLKDLQALIETHVCGMNMEQWLTLREPAQLCDWAAKQQSDAAKFVQFIVANEWQRLGSTAIDSVALPLDAVPTIGQQLSDPGRDELIAKPSWQGRCCETNVYTRQLAQPLVAAASRKWGNGLLARVTARLVELLGLFGAIRHDVTMLVNGECDGVIPSAKTDVNGVGLGVVDASRGCLIHRLRLARERIADYAILAPTEWNFHPAGIAVQGVIGLRFNSEAQLRTKVAMWINAIDPCVGHDLKINGL